jgi:predicted CXXCH cytochrome family protein
MRLARPAPPDRINFTARRLNELRTARTAAGMTAMTEQPDRPRGQRVGVQRMLALGALVGLLLAGGAGLAFFWTCLFGPAAAGRKAYGPPRRLETSGRLTVWWGDLPAAVHESAASSGEESNVRPADYVGPEACKECHHDNYESWSHHPHRWMNALADDSTVKGDFSGVSISYKGGKATFSHEGGDYLMRLERDGGKRTYRITQTIGSRFYQYYVGRQVEGPEPPGHPFYHKDHVLQFGYWLDQKEWVPIVHVGPEEPDAVRPDPFAPPEGGVHYAEYASSCNYCHTTFPLGDMFGRRATLMGAHAPKAMHWQMEDYLAETHPDELPRMTETLRGKAVQNPMVFWEASKYAATLGVSCEACHLGAREHVESKGAVKPKFFPSSPDLFVEGGGKTDFGRTHDNLNWACGRCHTGPRPSFAAGMSTWNSVEYADAARGSCYSKLRCIDCHNPHQALGREWSHTPDQDDAVCMKCHDRYESAAARVQHTHHPMGSDGARCLNCHMPHINEGLQDVVRTHMIYSPTRADMIYAGQPNACNLCHTDKSIDWTLGRFKDWYGAAYDDGKIAAAYHDRKQPAALGWLHGDDESVRLVAADALTRVHDAKALPDLLDALDDPFLLNRQFAAKELQERMGVRPGDFGYRFYMSDEERRRPLADLKAKWLPAGRANGR